MIFMLSSLFANFAHVASTLAFEGYMKFIPLILSLQKFNIAGRVKIWSLAALPKLAKLVNLLTAAPILSQGCFPWEVAKKTHLALIQNSELCWHRLNKFFQVFILTCTTIWKISDIFGFREVNNYFFENFILYLVYHCNIIFHVIWYNTIWKCFDFSFSL